MNILIVDDIRANRMLLKLILKKRGCVTDEAENGLESVNMVKKTDYDVIFMDMLMPKMNGYEATMEIKKVKPEIPIYVVSAYDIKDFPNEWKNANYEGIIPKPVNISKIDEIINKHKK